jgi:hypothetical protein
MVVVQPGLVVAPGQRLKPGYGVAERDDAQDSLFLTCDYPSPAIIYFYRQIIIFIRKQLVYFLS